MFPRSRSRTHFFRSITDPPAWFEAQKCDHQHQASGKLVETTGSDPGSRNMWYLNIKTTTSTTTLNFTHTHSPTHSNTHLHSTHICIHVHAFVQHIFLHLRSIRILHSLSIISHSIHSFSHSFSWSQQQHYEIKSDQNTHQINDLLHANTRPPTWFEVQKCDRALLSAAYARYQFVYRIFQFLNFVRPSALHLYLPAVFLWSWDLSLFSAASGTS